LRGAKKNFSTFVENAISHYIFAPANYSIMFLVNHIDVALNPVTGKYFFLLFLKKHLTTGYTA
jgi:hypothetical protein